MLIETSARRNFLKTLGLGAFGFTLAGASIPSPSQPGSPRDLLLFVGTYTTDKSEGIYLYRLDLSSGVLSRVSTTKGVVNPSYLTLDSQRRYLYAVNELDEFAGQKSGAVSAFAVEQKTGELRFLNQQPSGGGSPCYVSLDKSERFALVANYVGGNVSVFPVRTDGSLGEATDIKQDQGSSLNKERQEGPHAHSILPDESGRHVYACDLGTDKVMIYRFDSQAGKLIPNEQPWVQVQAGSGPRHLTFHPNGLYAYLMSELSATVTAFAHDSTRGTLKELQRINSLPADFKGMNTGAEIQLSPDGKFLYCSNRGHDSIAAFNLDAATGRLSFIAHTLTGGKSPRYFAIDPTGNFLLVANQNSDTIVVFRRDTQTGKLQPTGNVTEVPSPVCLKLIPPFA